MFMAFNRVIGLSSRGEAGSGLVLVLWESRLGETAKGQRFSVVTAVSLSGDRLTG
jgi:hypothetical protein